MQYELAVLTHGRSATLAPVLACFRENVSPQPHRIRVFADAVRDISPVTDALRAAFPDVAATEVDSSSRQHGFCGATGILWDACARQDSAEYVFWLEHDFLVERRVDLDQVADLMRQREDLAQVALVRNACNAEEARAGGLIASRPGAFSLRHDRVEAQDVSWDVTWLEHQAFFTTNPSLMHRDFMRANPWPDDGQPYCEGRFGVQLAEKGYRFGYWGDGIPWVRHIGSRDGTGY